MSSESKPSLKKIAPMPLSTTTSTIPTTTPVKKPTTTELPPLAHSEKQTRSQVSILTTNNDIYSTPQVGLADERGHHVPLRVHVAHKPTQEDTSRCYNPYAIQNEYEKYVRNGFVFEPLKSKSSQSMPESQIRQQQQQQQQQNSFKHKINPASASSSRMNNANVSFTSEAISPYARKENAVLINTQLKNPVENDKLLSYARGHLNKGFETEFQNFNNLKSFPDSQLQQQQQLQVQQQQEEFYRSKFPDSSKTNDEENDDDHVLYNKLKKSHNARKGAKTKEQNSGESATSLVGDDDDNDVVYQDEYDMINKMNRKTNANANIELINSINKELKRIKTGYQADTSNA